MNFCKCAEPILSTGRNRLAYIKKRFVSFSTLVLISFRFAKFLCNWASRDRNEAVVLNLPFSECSASIVPTMRFRMHCHRSRIVRQEKRVVSQEKIVQRSPSLPSVEGMKPKS
jgi:hypothetical protein